jgi:hypothetical protein
MGRRVRRYLDPSVGLMAWSAFAQGGWAMGGAWCPGVAVAWGDCRAWCPGPPALQSPGWAVGLGHGWTLVPWQAAWLGSGVTRYPGPWPRSGRAEGPGPRPRAPGRRRDGTTGWSLAARPDRGRGPGHPEGGGTGVPDGPSVAPCPAPSRLRSRRDGGDGAAGQVRWCPGIPPTEVDGPARDRGRWIVMAASESMRLGRAGGLVPRHQGVADGKAAGGRASWPGGVPSGDRRPGLTVHRDPGGVVPWWRVGTWVGGVAGCARRPGRGGTSARGAMSCAR